LRQNGLQAGLDYKPQPYKNPLATIKIKDQSESSTELIIYIMNAEQIIKIIPDHILDQIVLENGADNFVKKLKGKIVFKLFITLF